MSKIPKYDKMWKLYCPAWFSDADDITEPYIKYLVMMMFKTISLFIKAACLSLGSFSTKFSVYFSLVLVYISVWATFKAVLNIGLRGPISGSFWSPKYIPIQVLSHFLKYFPLVSHHCFTYLLGSTFMCISIMCPKGPISGYRVEVTMELVRPSGLSLGWMTSIDI